MKSASIVDVVSSCANWKRVCPDAERLARRCTRAALANGIAATGLTLPARVELTITLTDDAQQRQLNHKYRGRNAATNVLAFPGWQPGAQLPLGAPLMLGDVVLAFETV